MAAAQPPSLRNSGLKGFNDLPGAFNNIFRIATSCHAQNIRRPTVQERCLGVAGLPISYSCAGQDTYFLWLLANHGPMSM